MLLTKPLCCKAYERGESDVCYTIGQIYELGHGPAGADHQVRTTQFTCFTGTKVQILTGADTTRYYSVYLLYWYESTNTDGCGPGPDHQLAAQWYLACLEQACLQQAQQVQQSLNRAATEP
jgi:hypothetical protein